MKRTKKAGQEYFEMLEWTRCERMEKGVEGDSLDKETGRNGDRILMERKTLMGRDRRIIVKGKDERKKGRKVGRRRGST